MKFRITVHVEGDSAAEGRSRVNRIVAEMKRTKGVLSCKRGQPVSDQKWVRMRGAGDEAEQTLGINYGQMLGVIQRGGQ